MRLALRRSSRLLQDSEGDNDGLVSVSSAEWGERIAVLPADHLDLIGWGPLGSLGRALKSQQSDPLATIVAKIEESEKSPPQN
jgi:hypothetical protein